MSADTDLTTPLDWTRACTVADQLAIEALPDDLRGVVERYTRSRSPSKGNPVDPQYIKGRKGGVDAQRRHPAFCKTRMKVRSTRGTQLWDLLRGNVYASRPPYKRPSPVVSSGNSFSPRSRP